MIYLPFYRPVTEATKPPQQLSTPKSSGDINVTSLIAKLLTGYDKRLRPNFGGEENNFYSYYNFYRVCCLSSPILSRHVFLLDTSCMTTTTIECGCLHPSLHMA